MLQNKALSKEQAYIKAKYYCSYQERSHKETKEKLYSYGLRKTDVEELVASLIEEGYLNEERFAILYAGGKFRINNWGRIKIKISLQQKGISSYCISKALKAVNDDDYQRILHKLATSKWQTMNNEPVKSRRFKTYAYLLQKGYEPRLINPVIESLA